MMRTSVLGIVAVILIFVACQPEKGKEDTGLRVSGKVNKLKPGVKVYLEEIDGSSFKMVDTTQIGGDAIYEFVVNVTEPSFYRVNFANNQYVNFILNDTDVTVNADGDKEIGFAEVIGSTDTDYFFEISDMREGFQREMKNLNSRFVQARSQGQLQEAYNVQQLYVKLERDFQRDLKDKIWGIGPSITALFAINYLSNLEQEYAFLDSLAGRFRNELPNSKFTKQLLSQVDRMSALAVGAVAPEIELPDPEGNLVTLSSLRGQHVLIDFWAGWCKPCRVENPNVVRVYNKYHDQGFEIFGVSLDRTRQQWVSAIEQDGLTWEHGSELQYFRTKAAQDYNISAIPATYLIDPEGRIIAKNLRGPTLEAKLREIFEN